MNITHTLAHAERQGLARLDAQLLLLHALHRGADERAWLVAHDDEPIGDAAAARFGALCERRAAGEPVAYLVGHKEFFGLRLSVDERVLVPRPETETLVEWSLEVLRGRVQPALVDLGTGSGAIALAIAHARPDARVDAVDRSADALAVAAANAGALGLDITLHCASWLDGCSTRYDLIASNPPYVAAGDHHLDALRHEPFAALVAGPDGLVALRAIIAQAPDCLRPGGWLLLEHGYDQAEPVRALLIAVGFTQVGSRTDLAGTWRCSGGQWPDSG